MSHEASVDVYGWVLALALVACGGQNAGGGGSNQTADPEDVAQVLSAASDQLYRLEEPLSLAGIPVLAIAPLSQGIAPLDVYTWNCSGVAVTGDASDPDGDGIPTNATYNGQCTWSYSGTGGSASVSWTYHDINVQDPDDTDPDAGMRVSGGYVQWSWDVSGQGTVTVTWNITQHNLVKNGDHYDFTYEGNWDWSANGDTGKFRYNLSGTWTPDDMNNPWGDGTLSASGSFSGSGTGCTKGWTLQVTVTNAHYNSAQAEYDSGTVEVTGTDCDGNPYTWP